MLCLQSSVHADSGAALPLVFRPPGTLKWRPSLLYARHTFTHLQMASFVQNNQTTDLSSITQTTVVSRSVSLGLISAESQQHIVCHVCSRYVNASPDEPSLMSFSLQHFCRCQRLWYVCAPIKIRNTSLLIVAKSYLCISLFSGGCQLFATYKCQTSSVLAGDEANALCFYNHMQL